MEEELSQYELAELAGVGHQTIGRIERGGTHYKMKIDTAERLASALYCEVGDLFLPRELSHLGRPPGTGRPITVSTVTQISLDDVIFEVASTVTFEMPPKCDDCNYIKSASGACNCP